MNNTEFDNFNNVAPNAEHINKQDCAIKEKHSELFGCFDPGKKLTKENAEQNKFLKT